MNSILLAASLITQYLMSGDFSGFIIAIYTQSMGELFFGFILLGLTIPIYVKTESIGFVSLIWVLVYALLEIWIPTPGINLGKIILVIAVGVAFFNAFLKVRM